MVKWHVADTLSTNKMTSRAISTHTPLSLFPKPWHNSPHPAKVQALTSRLGLIHLYSHLTPCLSYLHSYQSNTASSIHRSQFLDIDSEVTTELVTIETSAAACSKARSVCVCLPHAYLLLYELKQGASIHILAREVRGAAEDKGIGRSARGWDKVLGGFG